MLHQAAELSIVGSTSEHLLYKKEESTELNFCKTKVGEQTRSMGIYIYTYTFES